MYDSGSGSKADYANTSIEDMSGGNDKPPRNNPNFYRPRIQQPEQSNIPISTTTERSISTTPRYGTDDPTEPIANGAAMSSDDPTKPIADGAAISSELPSKLLSTTDANATNTICPLTVDSHSNLLTVLSANANSIKNKMVSLKFNMDLLKPHVVIIQETKLKRKSLANFKGYRSFATIRGDNGGGLLIACTNSINPVLIFEGDCECEVLVVEAVLNTNIKIRFIAGYGPQECAPVIVREKYRCTIEEQVERAYLAGCMVLIAEDANAKLGKDIIPNDPHSMSENGKILDGMIRRQNLKIINISELCSGGPITRCREANGKKEEACIDFILTSQDLADHLQSAVIDSSQLHSLTKYSTTKGIPSIKRSDHFTLIAKFDIKWTEPKPVREEFFKLRDHDGLEKFKKLTTKSEKLKRCFQNNLRLEDACNRWYKEIDSVLHQCFKKIRVTSSPPKRTVDYEIHRTLQQIKTLKEKYMSAHHIQKPVLKVELDKHEKMMAELQGSRCRNIISEQTKYLTQDGTFSLNEAWKLKKKMFPRCSEAPFAVQDEHGNLV